MLLPLEKNIRIIKDQINFLNLTIEEIFFIENWIISKKGRNYIRKSGNVVIEEGNYILNFEVDHRLSQIFLFQFQSLSHCCPLPRPHLPATP